jgi:acylphosphatase
VRNLADGRVEVLACGNRENLSQLYNWLQQGPPLAKVEAVSYEERPWEEYDSFM